MAHNIIDVTSYTDAADYTDEPNIGRAQLSVPQAIKAEYYGADVTTPFPQVP